MKSASPSDIVLTRESVLDLMRVGAPVPVPGPIEIAVSLPPTTTSFSTKRPTGVTNSLPDRANFAMRSHNTPRPSFETLTSEYSVATMQAINREERPYHLSEDIAALRVLRETAERRQQQQGPKMSLSTQGGTSSSSARVPFRSESVSVRHHPGAERKMSLTTGASTTGSQQQGWRADVLDAICVTPSDARNRQRALRALDGRSRSSRGTARAQQHPTRSSSQRTQRRGSALRETQQERAEAAAATAAYNPYVGNIAVVRSTPPASSSAGGAHQRRPSISRCVSDSFKKMGRRLSDAVRRPSPAETLDVKHVQGSACYDARSDPPKSFHNLISLEEAQRKFGAGASAMGVDQRLYSQPALSRSSGDRYPNALPRRGKSLRHEKRSVAPVQAQPQAKREEVGAPTRRLERDTTFSGMIDAATRRESQWKPAGSKARPPSWEETDTITVGYSPTWPGVEYLDASEASLLSVDSAVDNEPIRRKSVLRADSGVMKDLPLLPSTTYASPQTVKYGKMPTYAYEAFDNNDQSESCSISDLATQMRNSNLTTSQIHDAYAEVHRLHERLDQPAAASAPVPGAWDGMDSMEDIHPRTIIDTVPRDGHTSWMVTDRSGKDAIQSWHARVPDRDPAAALMRRLEQERSGLVLSGQGSGRVARRSSIRRAPSERGRQGWL
ncbi:hypothetical protein BAUCODRAFT_385986 [Baudoinia panamericana UAMH 10762]|uniref:Uncharacterized protein n=1 Tax=Baudoinia panamericana (strain UAMH 10762) TaxID=717646 RepID=M2LWB0_BAUPA|nr:uncharacterized protein BAUCODRAFT_385986 [Baudoinia panamericana UAMH 10762]EMC98947.1 hypothetical protein BAUCODRAFT_385986 [Baudoinia panamericana UAMH 10762]